MLASQATADQSDLLNCLLYAIHKVAVFRFMTSSFEKQGVRWYEQISLICYQPLI